MKRSLTDIAVELNELLAKECDRLKIPGASIGIVHHGEELYCSYGVTNLDDPQDVNEDTLFFIGSTSKTFCSTALMALVEQGKLSLDDKVSKYLPGLPFPDPDVAEHITVGQLVDHTSGFTGDTSVSLGWGDTALGEAVKQMLAGSAQISPLGAYVSYSNLAVTICGHLIATVAGEPYEAVVRRLVLAPLGMDTTSYFPWEVAFRRLAAGHIATPDGPKPVPVFPTDRWLAPAGGALSSARDQMRYARFHLDGTASVSKPIDDGLRELMREPRASAGSVIEGVGISWLLASHGPIKLVEHGGNVSNLQVSTFSMAPSEQLALTVLTNSAGGGALGTVIKSSVLTWLTGVARPALTPIEQPELAEYVGSYPAGQWDVVVRDVGDGLEFGMKMTNVSENVPQELIDVFESRKTKVFFCAPDVVAPVDTPENTFADFIRDESGAIAFLRNGMRVAPKAASS